MWEKPKLELRALPSVLTALSKQHSSIPPVSTYPLPQLYSPYYMAPTEDRSGHSPTAVTFKAMKSRQFVLHARMTAGAGRGTGCSPAGKYLSFFLCACKALHFSWENLRTNKESQGWLHIRWSLSLPPLIPPSTGLPEAGV